MKKTSLFDADLHKAIVMFNMSGLLLDGQGNADMQLKKAIEKCKAMGIDPKTIRFHFAEPLSIKTIAKIHKKYSLKVGGLVVSPIWDFDVMSTTKNFVVKLNDIAQLPQVKLSDVDFGSRRKFSNPEGN